MKIALISDSHGNLPAFNAALDDIKKERCDEIICTGDVVNLFKESLQIWQTLTHLNIPILRGNHEDYIVRYSLEKEQPHWSKTHMRPIKLVAKQLGEGIANKVAKLPISLIKS